MGNALPQSSVSDDENSIKISGPSQVEPKVDLLKEALACYEGRKPFLKKSSPINATLHVSELIPGQPEGEKDVVLQSELFFSNPNFNRKQRKFRSKLDPSRTAEETYQTGRLKYSATVTQNLKGSRSNFLVIEKFMTDQELLHSYLVDERFCLDSDGDELSVADRLKLIWHFLAFRYHEFCYPDVLTQTWDSTIKPDLEDILRAKDTPIHTMNLIISPVQAARDVVSVREGIQASKISVEVNGPERGTNSEFDVNRLYESIMIDGNLHQSLPVPTRIPAEQN